MKLNFLHIFSKNTEVSYFMKIRLVGAELLHSVGRTDTTKLIVAFCNFANAPKNNLITKVTSEFLQNVRSSDRLRLSIVDVPIFCH